MLLAQYAVYLIECLWNEDGLMFLCIISPPHTYK